MNERGRERRREGINGKGEMGGWESKTGKSLIDAKFDESVCVMEDSDIGLKAGLVKDYDDQL